jgi:phenylpyruvate tautomerase PptA (4-oxalocrotonate tautomerase family)
MPVIKVWCLPLDQKQKDLKRLYSKIVKAVTSVSELDLKDGKDMTILFVPDLMEYGLGAEIIVEISGLFERPERTPEVLQRLAENVGSAVKELYPKAKVECFIYTFNPRQGFWTSDQKLK